MLVGVAYLRPLLTADQAREAILFDLESLPRRRPALLSWAGFLYGQPIEREQKPGLAAGRAAEED